MPPYNWTCHVCERSNLAAKEVCATCGFPWEADGRDIETARKKRNAGFQASPRLLKDSPNVVRRFSGFVLASEIRIALAALFGTALLVIVTSWEKYSDPSFVDGIRVESHGMLLDIAVIGIFILWLNLRRQEAERLRRFDEEIDDFREWKSEEASYRIAGRVRKLNAAGRNYAVLSRCHLRRANLPRIQLSDAPMHQVDLGEANLKGAKLSNVDLDTAFLGYSDLRGASITGSNLTRARLVYCKADGANFQKSVFRKAVFNGARLRGADFRGCDLDGSIFDGADLGGADLRLTTGITVEMLARAHSLSYTRFDATLLAALKLHCPDLLVTNRKHSRFQPKARRVIRHSSTEPTSKQDVSDSS